MRNFIIVPPAIVARGCVDHFQLVSAFRALLDNATQTPCKSSLHIRAGKIKLISLRFKICSIKDVLMRANFHLAPPELLSSQHKIRQMKKMAEA